METIGQRVLKRFNEAYPDEPQKLLAKRIDMPTDVLSRALSGKRAFSSIELARVADVLNEDLHWLITGAPDPHRLVVAARHAYDFASGRRSVPGRDGDHNLLKNIGLAYRQAYQDAPLPASALPSTPADVRNALGSDFVPAFADRLEQELGVDVIRVEGLSTSYCFEIAGRRVIVVAATGNWFRENWDIAHELGHLVLGHSSSDQAEDVVSLQEAQANGFAAELLLPATEMRAQDWDNIDAVQLAQRVWDLGVSTDALGRRLASLGIGSRLVNEWANQTTQRLLRRHWQSCQRPGDDLITRRMDVATSRRIPLGLQEAHLDLIARGSLGKGTLAWLLGIDADNLEVDMPLAENDVDTDELAHALGL